MRFICRGVPKQTPPSGLPARGIEQTFYGALCMEVIDPYGNRIRFNERLNEPPPA